MTPALTCLFNEVADLQSLTLSKKEILTHMFSCEFCKIFHNPIFKGPKKLSIFAKKRHFTVDVRPGSKYTSLSSHEKMKKSEKLKLEKFSSLANSDHKFIRSSFT